MRLRRDIITELDRVVRSNLIELRAEALLGHPDSSVRGFAAETLREIEVFKSSVDSYGSVFHVLRRAA